MSNELRPWKNLVFQGDACCKRVNEIPADILKKATLKAENGQHILAHSETGHNHVIPADDVVLWPVDQFTSYMEVKTPTVLKHLRNFRTHGDIPFEIGFYRITRQTEVLERQRRAVAD